MISAAPVSVSRNSLASLLACISMVSLFGMTTEIEAGQLGIAGTEPIVPPLPSTRIVGSRMANGVQQLDGLVCTNCVFENVVLTYAGGNFELSNPQFKNDVIIEFKGAASNGVELFKKLMSPPQAPRKSPRYNPKANPKVPVAMTLSNDDLRSEGAER